MKGNYSKGRPSECKECGKPFLKVSQNNIYCSKSCRETRYDREGRTKLWTRSYREKNPELIILKTLRNRAKNKGLEFNLTPDDIIIPEKCPILGLKLEMSEGNGGSKNSPSVDRIDNSKGYIKGNVQIISHLANSMKSFANKEELLMFANWIISNEEIL